MATNSHTEMRPFQACLFLTTLISNFAIYASSLYGEFPRNIDNETHMNINIQFVPVGGKILLQATDGKKNSFIIRTNKTPDKTERIIIEFNGQTWQHPILLRTTPNVYRLKIGLLFRDNNLYEVLGASQTLLLSNIFNRNRVTSEDPYSETPREKSEYSIGYDDSSTESDPARKIIGCIHQFQINNIPISFTSNGYTFDKICWKSQAKYIFPPGGNTESKNIGNINYHFCDCGLTSINTAAHCYRNLGQKDNQPRSYKALNDRQSTTVMKLAWKTQFNRCLLEIKSTNGSKIVVIYIDKLIKEVQIKVFDNNLKKSFTKSLFLINIAKIHLLIVSYAKNELTVKISNGDQVTQFTLTNYDSMEFVTVGSTAKKDLCHRIGNEFDFQYNKTKLELLNVGKVDYIQYTMMASAPLALLIAIPLIFLLIRGAKTKKTIKTKEINIYDNSIEQHPNLSKPGEIQLESLYDEA